MLILLTIVHVIVCIFLIIVVLLQSGKAADLAGAFGGMGSQTAFGPRGSATLLSKATTVSAIVFMITSLSLSILATRGAGREDGAGHGAGQRADGSGRRRPGSGERSRAGDANVTTAGRQVGPAAAFPRPQGKPGPRHRPNRRSSAPCGGGGIGRRTSLRC